MANTNAPMGFRLVLTGGHEPIRRKRPVNTDNANAIAPGDAYTIQADGTVTRCDNAHPPNGVVEGIDLEGVDEGPVSRDYLPAGIAGNIIGFEDPTAQFEVQTNAVIPLTAFDTGAEVNIVDAAPNAIPAQSRQQVGDVGGNQFRLVGSIDRPLNTPFIQYAKVTVGLIPANVQ